MQMTSEEQPKDADSQGAPCRQAGASFRGKAGRRNGSCLFRERQKGQRCGSREYAEFISLTEGPGSDGCGANLIRLRRSWRIPENRGRADEPSALEGPGEEYGSAEL